MYLLSMSYDYKPQVLTRTRKHPQRNFVTKYNNINDGKSSWFSNQDDCSVKVAEIDKRGKLAAITKFYNCA